MPHGLVQDHDLEVKLLGKHVVQLEISVTPEPEDHIHADLGRDGFVKALVVIALLDTSHKHLMEPRAMKRSLPNNIKDFIVHFDICPFGPLVHHILKACLHGVWLLLFKRSTNYLIRLNISLDKILTLMVLYNMFL